MDYAKKNVHDFWNSASCGETLYLDSHDKESYRAQAEKRYELEPYIQEFAQFSRYANKEVLEIGVGLGADHQQFAEAGANLKGLDLTQRAVLHTTNRLKSFNLYSEIEVGDAEHLPYKDQSFDLVYSWGVLHHTPDTPKSIQEVYRVLKPGGEAKIMIYHKYSLVGYMLWIKYALLKLKPFTPLSVIYDQYLESPGTKAYSVAEAKALFKSFRTVEIKTVLTHGDLLSSQAGQRHRGLTLFVAKVFWPRWLIKNVFKSQGLFMLITANK